MKFKTVFHKFNSLCYFCISLIQFSFLFVFHSCFICLRWRCGAFVLRYEMWKMWKHFVTHFQHSMVFWLHHYEGWCTSNGAADARTNTISLPISFGSCFLSEFNSNIECACYFPARSWNPSLQSISLISIFGNNYRSHQSVPFRLRWSYSYNPPSAQGSKIPLSMFTDRFEKLQ